MEFCSLKGNIYFFLGNFMMCESVLATWPSYCYWPSLWSGVFIEKLIITQLV